MGRYHGDGDPDHPIVQLQMEEMRPNVNQEGSDKVLPPSPYPIPILNY